MAGIIYTREHVDELAFNLVDETGECRMFTVSNDGHAFEHHGFYDGEFSSYQEAVNFFNKSSWSPITSVADYEFFRLVELSASLGKTVDEVQYIHPQEEEEAARGIAWNTSWDLPAGIRVMSVRKVD